MSNVFEQSENDISKINEALSEVESKITGHDYGIPLTDDLSSEKGKRTAEADRLNDSNYTGSKIVNILQQIKVNNDFMDISRADMDCTEGSAYQVSPVFDYGNFDIDSFDCVSIKISDTDLDLIKQNVDWPSIFAEIERSAQDPFAMDFFDDGDIEYRPVRAGITLVKGKGGTSSRSRNTATNEGDAIRFAKSLDIPMKMHIENGELVFKANLSRLDLSDLQRMTDLSNMRSVLSLITR